MGDYEGAANVTGITKEHSQSTDWTMEERRILEGMIAGFWGVPVVGTAEQVAERMIAMHDAGADGIAISFVSYDEGLQRMEEQILPLLVDAGLWHAVEAPAASTAR